MFSLRTKREQGPFRKLFVHMRLFLAGVALVAAASLGACSGQDYSSEKPEQAATTEANNTKATPEETAVEESTEVTAEASMEENVASGFSRAEDEYASQWHGEPVPAPPSNIQSSAPSADWRTPSQKAGFNEAGQDVSNTPVISPEERRERGVCFRNYFESLPPNQRGPESQRVTVEANVQGVTPYDIVGC